MNITCFKNLCGSANIMLLGELPSILLIYSNGQAYDNWVTSLGILTTHKLFIALMYFGLIYSGAAALYLGNGDPGIKLRNTSDDIPPNYIETHWIAKTKSSSTCLP